MNRYTENRLAADLADLNAVLEKHKHQYRLSQGSSYGHATVDLATPEQAAQHCCQMRLAAGTPREVLAQCTAWVCRNI